MEGFLNYNQENQKLIGRRHKFTPPHIDSLLPDEIFVFGSNLEGNHDGGVARMALKKFGAIYGQGVGLQGQSYTIPTMQGGVEKIAPFVNDFIEFAKININKIFYVTPIGCGIAGFTFEQIAPLFIDAISLSNVYLPKPFLDVLDAL